MARDWPAVQSKLPGLRRSNDTPTAFRSKVAHERCGAAKLVGGPAQCDAAAAAVEHNKDVACWQASNGPQELVEPYQVAEVVAVLGVDGNEEAGLVPHCIELSHPAVPMPSEEDHQRVFWL